MANKLLLLGLDGLDTEFVDENIEELPNISRLRSSASIGKLESVLPPVTIPAWGAAFTGKHPEKLKRFDMEVLDADFNYRFSPKERKEFMNNAFWNFSESEFAVLNVPCTEIDEINGYMVTGPFNVSEEDCYPSGLSEEIDDISEIRADMGEKAGQKRKTAFSKFESGKRILNYFLENKSVDTYFYVFQVTDTLMHHCENEKQLLEAYKRADEYLGELMERDLDIIVFSDHGAVKTTESYSINTWFRDNGYLEMEDSGSSGSMPVWKKPLLKIGEKAMQSGFKDQLVKLNNLYESLTGEEFRKTGKIDLDSVDWSKTEAFSYTIATCRYAGVWVNDRRFPEGLVDDRKAKKKELKEKIEKIDKVEKVLLKEEAFQVDVPTFPDLVIFYEEGVKQDSQLRDTPVSEINTYMHRKEGFMGLYGDAFDRVPEGAELIDVAPTVLHYLGEDIPEEMDGKVLDIFAEGTEPAEREPERFSEEVSNIDF
jgi:predicted AlkP superfamily phosphohydrolase/phosphomutase